MDKRTRAKFTTLAKRVNEASGTAADVATAKTDIENLKSSKANIEDLTAAAGRIDVLEAESASVKQLVAGKASVADLTAATGRIDDLEADTASLEQAVVEKASIADLNATNAEISNLKTDKADVDLLNVVKATIEDLLVRGGIITDSLTGVEINATKFLTGVTIIGDVIKAGTLAADRIILTGENGLIYELNVNAGNLTASQLTQEQYKQALDGSVLVASSITTDKLAAGSVTAQVIASRAVKADHIESGAITTDKLAAKAVKAEKIDVDNLFAQDITASGTITGAQLIGAILSGDAIDIQAETTGDFAGGGVQIMSTSEPEVDGDETILPPRFKIYVYGDTSSSLLEMRRNAIGLTSRQVAISAGMQIDIGDPDMTGTMVYLHGHVFLPGGSLADTDYDSTTYTSFSGGVLSSGSVVVTKKLGMCCISGTVTLSKSISAWTTILSSSKVPAPQHGELVPFEASQWGTSYARPLRGKVTPDGGLQLVYGAAGNYVFTIAYPID